MKAAIDARKWWLRNARAAQLPPEHYEDWSYFVARSGRGFGKTRLSTEDCAWYAATHPGHFIHVVCPTSIDVRRVYFEGPSGFLRVTPPEEIAKIVRSPDYIVTMKNGAVIRGFSAEEPDRLRGPQCSRAYCDELAAWRYEETWDQLLFGLRLGENPRAIITTTPRPTPLVRRLLGDPLTFEVRGSTFDNAANLSAKALEAYKRRYEGTRLGRQELYGEVLDDVPGALWTRQMIDDARAIDPARVPAFERVVVAIDPSGVRNEMDMGADLVGIVVAARGVDGRGYVLGDYSCRTTPLKWAQRAVTVFKRFNADRIVAERNFGGAMVEAVIRSADSNVPYREVTASRGKVVRAEPIAALYEQGRISHLGARFDPHRGPHDEDDLAALEDQLCCMTSTGYLGEGSPDRVDACVWALTDLFPVDSTDGFLGHYRQAAAALEDKKDAAEIGWLPTKRKEKQ